MVFQQNLLEKAYFIAKMSGLTMVRPVSSDFWKAPLDYTRPWCKIRLLIACASLSVSADERKMRANSEKTSELAKNDGKREGEIP